MYRAFSLILCLASFVYGDGDQPFANPSPVDTAVERGLAALVKMQGTDGSIGAGAGISALSGMAILAGGHTPTRGLYREASAKVLNYVLSRQDTASGYFHGRDPYMYEHGFATLYLAECYGMAPSERIRKSLEAAIGVIHRSQNTEGGWRYWPAAGSADLSVTICQVMALRAAWNVGVGGTASLDACARAIAYVHARATGNGGFSYTADGGNWGTEGPEGVPRAAAGAMSLIGAGISDAADPHLGPALRFIRRHVAGHLKGNQYFWYGQYYAAQAMFHSPEHEDWKHYWAQVVPVLLGKQAADASWPGIDYPEAEAAYGTAMALIILQIPNGYLPIFQR